MPPTIHDIVGCLVIGVWTNVFLYALECFFVFSYFNKYRNDEVWVKLLVAAAWVNDTLATAFSCHAVYNYTIVGFGNMQGLADPGWTFPATAATIGFSVFFTQSYLVWRYFTISKNRYLSAFLATAVLAGLGFNWYCCKKFGSLDSKNLLDRDALSVLAKAFVGMEAGTDFLVSMGLVAVLAQHYRESAFTGTRSLLLRLMLLSIESNLVTTAVAIAALITFVGSSETNGGLAIGYNLGRVHTLTLLYNLHIRKSSTDESEGSAQGSSPSFQLNSVKTRRTEAQIAQSRSVMDQSIPISLEAGVRRPSFAESTEKP